MMQPPARPGGRVGTRLLGLVFVILLVAGAGGAATWAVMDRLYRPARDLASLPNFDEFLRVRELIEEEYVSEDVDPSLLLEGAMQGMVDALGDPYSAYMSRDRYEELVIDTRGSYDGIGVVIEQRDGFATVVTPFKGTPAWESGLKPGDRIVAVDGLDVVGVPIDRVVELIRGPANTEVVLTVARSEADRPLDIPVTRATVDIPTVEGRMLTPEEVAGAVRRTGAGEVPVTPEAGSIGYLVISRFSQATARDTGEALFKLYRDGARGLVLDLRYNPGGLLDVSLQVAEYFVPAGPVVHVVDRDGNRATYNARGGGTPLPVVVLVNEGSASAAEILAGAIADREVGILVGTQTFGKASVQNLYDLEGGAGLRLTTARYLTPNGTLIDGVGLQPDVIVEALPSGADDSGPDSGGAEPDRAGFGEAEPGGEDDGVVGELQDHQLVAALDLLCRRLVTGDWPEGAGPESEPGS